MVPDPLHWIGKPGSRVQLLWRLSDHDGERECCPVPGTVVGPGLRTLNDVWRFYIEWDDHFGDGWYDEYQLQQVKEE